MIESLTKDNHFVIDEIWTNTELEPAEEIAQFLKREEDTSFSYLNLKNTDPYKSLYSGQKWDQTASLITVSLIEGEIK